MVTYRYMYIHSETTFLLIVRTKYWERDFINHIMKESYRVSSTIYVSLVKGILCCIESMIPSWSTLRIFFMCRRISFFTVICGLRGMKVFVNIQCLQCACNLRQLLSCSDWSAILHIQRLPVNVTQSTDPPIHLFTFKTTFSVIYFCCQYFLF